MSLTSKQKEYIRKNARYFTIETLAGDLGLERKIIEKYLKKIWRRDKYLKYISKNKPENISHDQQEEFILGEFVLKNIFIFIGLLILVLAVFFNSLGNGFVSDDIQSVVENTYIKNIKGVLSIGIFGIIQRSLYFLAYTFADINPAFYRFYNILFHLGSTALVFIILSILAKKRIAIMTAAIFAIHPILTESITWVSGFPYAVGAFFMLFTFLLYISNAKKIWWLLTFFIALIELDKSIVFPFIIILYEFSLGGFVRIKQNWKKLAIFFGVSFVWILLYVNKVSMRISAIESMNYQDHGGLYNPLIQVPIAIGSYLKLMFWPADLTLYHTEVNFSAGQYLAYLLVFLIYLSAVVWSWKKNRMVFFWLSFLFISLLPTLTPFKIAWVVAERYVYLGSIGIFVALAFFFNWIYEKMQARNEQYRPALIAVFMIIILALSTRTIIRNTDWKNEDTLWIATAKTSPSGPNIHNNLGDVYARRGDMEKSVEEFKKALEINPQYADVYHNLANDYQMMGKAELAIENYQKALEINPKLWQSHQNLAALYFNLQDYKKAEEEIKKALEINPQEKSLQENMQRIRESLQ